MFINTSISLHTFCSRCFFAEKIPLLQRKMNCAILVKTMKRGEIMKAAICEDEILFSEKLSDGVRNFFLEKGIDTEIECFSDGKAFAENFTESHGYDVIFMDINLGFGKDGMEYAARLREIDKTVPIIFVTSLENRAVDGYDVGAYGFVVKKNIAEKLPRVLEKLYKELYCKKSIALTGKDNTEIVLADNILWAQSVGRGTEIYLVDGIFSDIRSISHFAELLDPDDFISVHKSIYVNISKIKRINTDTVMLCDNTSVPLSRRNRKNVMLAVMKKVGGK